MKDTIQQMYCDVFYLFRPIIEIGNIRYTECKTLLIINIRNCFNTLQKNRRPNNGFSTRYALFVSCSNECSSTEVNLTYVVFGFVLRLYILYCRALLGGICLHCTPIKD